MNIAKALVRIEDANIRHKVFNALLEMGYEKGACDPYKIHPYILIGENIAMIRAHNAVDNQYECKPPIRDEGFIDCNAYTPNGTEEEAVKLFWELAKMRDDDSSTEWVRLDQPKESAGENTWVDTSYHKDWSSSSELIEAVCENWVTALTPLEVAEAFKEGRIEL